MVQGLVTTVGAEKLPILTVRFFAESTVVMEKDDGFLIRQSRSLFR